MHSAKAVHYRDMVFTVPTQVYEPAEDTFLLLESLELNLTPHDTVLDMGTGCGIIGIVAAKKARRVVAVDVNSYAVDCARKNAEANCVAEKIVVRLGDLFNPINIDDQFSVIVFNAPYLPSRRQKKKDWIDSAWSGGADGRQLIDRFISEAPRFLAENGRIFLVQSTLSNVKRTLQRLRMLGFQARIVVEKAFFFERIVVIMAEREG